MVRGARRTSNIKLPLVMLLTASLVIFGGWKALQMWPERTEDVLAEIVEDSIVQTVSAEKIIGDYDVSYIVQEGDVLTDVFNGHQIPFQELVALEQVESDIFDFTEINIGKTVYYSLYDEGSDLRLEEVYYQADASRVIHARQTSGGWVLEEVPIIYEIREARAFGQIDSSLYLSALEAGLDEVVILKLADIFAWDIDFALQTRKGDTYKVIYEEKYLDGEFITSGKILAAEFINDGRDFRGVYFSPDGDMNTYFDEEGNALQKSFLKAPVNYRYVTSGFSNARFHPVLGTVLPHNGVDYAAAYGTPIISVADGIVARMGWDGAYGNRIEIKHGDRYGTQYSHMSGFVSSMKAGDPIDQGQIVGYVGSTGYSTGNHVHFSITDRGSYVNPNKVDVPDGDPVAEEYLEEYKGVVQKWLYELESIN